MFYDKDELPLLATKRHSRDSLSGGRSIEASNHFALPRNVTPVTFYVTIIIF